MSYPNIIYFLWYTQKRYSIARLWGDKQLSEPMLIEVAPSIPFYMQYTAISDHIITTLDCALVLH